MKKRQFTWVRGQTSKEVVCLLQVHLVGDHPGNATTPVRRPVFHSPELFPIILNALKTRSRDQPDFWTSTTVFQPQLSILT